MEHAKQCPYCAEMIDDRAIICRYCRSLIGASEIERRGEFVKVRLKAQDKIYHGDIFVPSHLCRVSDVINDSRYFILLSNAKEETKSSEVTIGFLAINKSIVEWVRLMGSYS